MLAGASTNSALAELIGDVAALKARVLGCEAALHHLALHVGAALNSYKDPTPRPETKNERH